MGKRDGFLVLVMTLLFGMLFFATFSYAADCPASCPGAQCVCGQCPDSLKGFGQVVIHNITYSCNNVMDLLCPEDYEDSRNSSIYGDCSSCMDPDCTGTVSGVVKNIEGLPVDRASVSSNTIRWNLSAPLMDNSTFTSVFGLYSMQVVTGKYFISASKESYDTALIEARIWRKKNTIVNLTLLNGTCHEDCTNSYGRCNAACEGVDFYNGSSSCRFHDSQARSLCNNRILGTSVFYAPHNETHAFFIDCCEGKPYLNYYSKANVQSGAIKDLINIEKIGRYNDVPVKIVVAYWSPVYE